MIASLSRVSDDLLHEPTLIILSVSFIATISILSIRFIPVTLHLDVVACYVKVRIPMRGVMNFMLSKHLK
jgi:hypothetical protein